MYKRRADKQLTKDNWEEEEEDDTGTREQSNLASETVLKQRVIRKAHRRLNKLSDQETPAAKPFASFSGFGSPSTSSTSTATFTFGSSSASNSTPNPFAALTNLTSLPNSTASATSPPNSKSGSSSLTNSNSLPKSVAPVSSPNAKSSGPPSFTNLTTTPIRANPAGSVTVDSEYRSQVSALNKSLLKWLQQHVSETPCCLLTPVFDDYAVHLSKLQQELKLRVAAPTVASTSVTSSSTSTSTFSFGAKSSLVSSTPSTATFSFGAPISTSSTMNFSFGGPVSTASSSATFSFGDKPSSASTNSSTFSFGAAVSTTSKTSSSATFSFGGAAATTSSTATFSFGVPLSSSAGSPSGNTLSAATSQPSGFGAGFFGFGTKPSAPAQPQEVEEENEEPPVAVVNVVEEPDAVYSKRCKLFYKKDESYVEKGVGMLHLKSSSGKSQLLVRADTNLGNILLNIQLNSSIPTQRLGKNNVMLACVPNPPLDPKDPELESDGPVPLLIRVKTEIDADQLLEKIDEMKTNQ